MSSLKNFSKLIHKKKGLLKCIFTTLLFQLVVTSLTFIIIYRSEFIKKRQNSSNLLNSLLFLFFAIALIFTMSSYNLSFMQRSLLFVLFSILQGLFLGYNLKYLRGNTILSALVFTGVLFLLMLLVGFIMVYFNVDLSWLGVILFFLLLFLIIVRIMNYFIPYSKSSDLYLRIFALLLFSVYIVYDTNIILLRYDAIKYDRDCILGALDYYLDIINIFVNSLHR